MKLSPILMEKFVKYLPLFTSADDPLSDIFWKAKIYQISDTQQFQAKLFVWDSYDCYLAQWKHNSSSPLFLSLEEAEAYVLDHWANLFF